MAEVIKAGQKLTQEMKFWLDSIKGKDVYVKARIIREDGTISWKSKKSDETSKVYDFQLKGFTVIWREDPVGDFKPALSFKKLRLIDDRLEIYSSGGNKLVSAIELVDKSYTNFEFKNPSFEKFENGKLAFKIRNKIDRVEVKFIFETEESIENFKKFLEEIKIIDSKKEEEAQVDAELEALKRAQLAAQEEDIEDPDAVSAIDLDDDDDENSDTVDAKIID